MCKFAKLCFSISWTFLYLVVWFQVVRFRARTLLLHAVFRTQVLQFCVISGVAMQRMLSASPALGGFFSSWRAQYTSTSLLLWGQDPNYKSAGILVSSSGNLLALHLRKAETCPWRNSCALVQNQTFCAWLLSARWCAPDYLLFRNFYFGQWLKIEHHQNWKSTITLFCLVYQYTSSGRAGKLKAMEVNQLNIVVCWSM